jgi:flagellar biosynthesis GTPase FlhF
MTDKKARIEYLLSEAGRKKSLLAGGDGKQHQVIETDATPEIIALADVDSEGNVKLQVGFESLSGNVYGVGVKKVPMKDYWASSKTGWKWYTEKETHFFDDLQAVGTLVAWEQARVERLQAAERDPKNLEIIAQLEARNKAEKEKREAQEAQEAANKAKREAEREAREAEEAARREEREKEKRQWIAEFGSDYLKRAVKLGYDCQRQYVTERAEKEFPGFDVDFDNYADWRSRSCPSEEALEIVEDAQERGFATAKVVWLTDPPYKWNDYEDGEYEAREAVVVENYLGKYTLVKEF